MLELKPERLHLLLDANAQSLSICGKSLVADTCGAIFWRAEKALLVADLHLEMGSACAEAGTMQPPYDTRQTLVRLAEAIDRYDPDRIVALGDTPHDSEGSSRVAEADLEILQMMQEDREWIWITGNHDAAIPSGLGGHVCHELKLGGLTLRHRPTWGCVTHEIAGHMHPAARLSLYGYSIRRPCFVGNGRRMVMPAFGAFAGGLNVLDEAFQPLFGNGGLAVWMLGAEGLYPVATRLLSSD
jgi:DNA ligase-associated metallophosphoesterase